jgi:hypothetical protein
MKKMLPVMFSIVLSTMLMASCAGSSNADPSNSPVANNTSGSVDNGENEIRSYKIEQDDRFTALSVGIDTVLLNWEPIAGAEKYLLEVMISDDQFLSLALLSSDQTSFEDSDVPADTVFIYKLTALSNGERGELRQAMLTTPPQVIDPLVVTIEFDQTQPAYDMSSIDPENFDPSIFADMFPSDDTGDDSGESEFNFDLSLFAPIPVTSTSVIGSSGGEVTVTATNGIVYILSVPAGALPFDMPITLRPVSAIPDLPFDGGMDGAVMIEPEEIPFSIPATLTMLAPEAFVPTSGELALGFAFEAEGKEFHLYPLLGNNPQATAGARVAKRAAVVTQAGPLAEIARQQLEKGGGYGKGSGSAQDVKNVNKRPSSKPANRAAAKAATAQQKSKFVQPLDYDEDDLAPLPSKEQMDFGRQGTAIQQKLSKADNWNKFLEAIEEFNEYYNKGGEKYNDELNKKILDELVKKAHEFLSKNKAQCLSADDLKAQSLVERLITPGNPAMKAIASQFKAKYGEKLLNDLTYMMKACSYELDLKSAISYEAFGSTRFTSAVADKIQLFPVFANGQVFLFGSGKITMEQRDAGVCNYPVQQYDNLILAIQKLEPVFKDDKIVDFSLRDYKVAGMEQLTGLKVTEGEKCPTMMKFVGGGDFWSGFFISARATFGTFTLRDWKIEGDTTQGGAITAKWSAVNPSFNPMGAGGKMSEDSKFTLTIRPYSRK